MLVCLSGGKVAAGDASVSTFRQPHGREGCLVAGDINPPLPQRSAWGLALKRGAGAPPQRPGLGPAGDGKHTNGKATRQMLGGGEQTQGEGRRAPRPDCEPAARNSRRAQVGAGHRS